jgi:TPP-dependent pyruvate/acetoin dehydrogenase alpha subunit
MALDYVRAGNGPLLMELNTYRYRGHSMSDPAKYRSREEVQDVREKHDPIDGLKKNCWRRGISEDDIKGIDKRMRRMSNEAADFAESFTGAGCGRTVHRRSGGELLMAIELKMPALSPTMEEGTLARWLVKEGDA